MEQLEPRMLLSADWTFMVYMAGDNDLEDDMIGAFLDIASVGSTEDVNLLVQMDRVPGEDARYDNWTDCRRGLVEQNDEPDSAWGESIGEVDTASKAVLQSFLEWGLSYEANHYAVVVRDHGGGPSRELHRALERSSV